MVRTKIFVNASVRGLYPRVDGKKFRPSVWCSSGELTCKNGHSVKILRRDAEHGTEFQSIYQYNDEINVEGRWTSPSAPESRYARNAAAWLVFALFTLASCAQLRRPDRVQKVRVAGRRLGRTRIHDHVLIARAACAVVPSGHVDATGRRAQTPVRSGGTLVHVQLASGSFKRVRTRAYVRARAHAAVQTLLSAHSCVNKIINDNGCPQKRNRSAKTWWAVFRTTVGNVRDKC